eukprot:scaffold150849_cov46-Prasinocladus_malaysianus.AAC.1
MAKFLCGEKQFCRCDEVIFNALKRVLFIWHGDCNLYDTASESFTLHLWCNDRENVSCAGRGMSGPNYHREPGRQSSPACGAVRSHT